jgi:5-(carboxyamino)imidazole ribonucleotide synthase
MSVKTVGVLGGGQLAWMMAAAAKELDISLIVQTAKENDPATSLAADVVVAGIGDVQAIAQLGKRCDMITFENEFVDLAALGKLAEQGVCFRPNLSVLAPLLDKYDQRCHLQSLGLPVPKFITLPDGKPQGEFPSPPVKALGLPVVMKARRHGYDGQGTTVIQTWQELEQTWSAWGYPSILLEEFIPFERELAAIATRSVSGEFTLHPIVETQQENQVCRRVIAPADISSEAAAKIEAIARTLMENSQAVGTFGIEMFYTPSGEILVNEIAPRTHNSGHFSIDACTTSQFSQHLRAVCDLPLGNTQLKAPGAVMVNLLGYEHATSDYREKRQQLEQIPQANVYWYGKTQSRPGRKLGHVTVLLDETTEPAKRQQALAISQKVESLWYK